MQTGYLIVNALGCVLLITSTMVVLSKKLKNSAILYAVQSAVLVSIFLTLAITTSSTELYKWSATAFVTKVVLVPAIMLWTIKKIDDPDKDLPGKLTPIKCILLVVVELVICWFAVTGITLPAAAEVHPALAISLAHFFIGLTCIITQRNILKQVFGYCLMENGSHLTLALLASNAPGLVEIGVATDAIFAVVIMVIVAMQIYRKTKSLDVQDLKELKG